MIYGPRPLDQWMTLKRVYYRDQAEVNFEDPIKKEILNITPRNGFSRYLQSLIGEGLFFIHYGPRGVHRRFDY